MKLSFATNGPIYEDLCGHTEPNDRYLGTIIVNNEAYDIFVYQDNALNSKVPDMNLCFRYGPNYNDYLSPGNINTYNDRISSTDKNNRSIFGTKVLPLIQKYLNGSKKDGPIQDNKSFQQNVEKNIKQIKETSNIKDKYELLLVLSDMLEESNDYKWKQQAEFVRNKAESYKDLMELEGPIEPVKELSILENELFHKLQNTLLYKLFKLAQNQQKVLEKLAGRDWHFSNDVRKALGIEGTKYRPDATAEAVLPSGERAKLISAKEAHEKGFNARIFIECPFCNKWIPMGRISQHEEPCKLKDDVIEQKFKKEIKGFAEQIEKESDIHIKYELLLVLADKLEESSNRKWRSKALLCRNKANDYKKIIDIEGPHKPVNEFNLQRMYFKR